MMLVACKIAILCSHQQSTIKPSTDNKTANKEFMLSTQKQIYIYLCIYAYIQKNNSNYNNRNSVKPYRCQHQLSFNEYRKLLLALDDGHALYQFVPQYLVALAQASVISVFLTSTTKTTATQCPASAIRKCIYYGLGETLVNR